jgi:hypothetical protein
MRRIAAASLLIINAACAPTQMVTGTLRKPIPASEVVIYSVAPPNFEQIAVLSASAKTAFAVGGQKSIDKVVKRLTMQAAKLGANGLILEDFSDEQSLSLGAGVGSDSYTRNGSISLGGGGFIGVFKKTGNGRAIYVPRD